MVEQVSTQWVMDVRRANAAEGAHQEDVAQPVDGMEPGLEAYVALPLTEPSVIQPESEQPLPSPIAPSIDAAEQPQ